MRNLVSNTNDTPPAGVPLHVWQALSGLRDAKEPLRFRVKPWDAWLAVAILQFAWRNPQLDDVQRQTVERMGRSIQRSIAKVAPEAAAILEDGWDRSKDVSP